MLQLADLQLKQDVSGRAAAAVQGSWGGAKSESDQKLLPGRRKSAVNTSHDPVLDVYAL